MKTIKKINTDYSGTSANSGSNGLPDSIISKMNDRKIKTRGPRKRPTLLELAVEYESPFVPPNIGDLDCTKEEYVQGRDHIATRQFMRHIARILVKEALSTISKGVPNANT
jgi:hypothetical protein